MIEKIKSALKTKYADKGFSEEVFDGVASLASITVTDESQIDAFVNNAEVGLKSFQSETDRRVNQIQSERDRLKNELESKQDPPEPPKPTGPTGNDDIPDYVKELQKKIEGLESQKQQEQQLQNQAVMKAEAKRKMIEKGVKESSCDEILDAISISEGETVDSLAEKGVEKNNKWQSLYTPEAGPVQNPSISDEADSAVEEFFKKKAAEKDNS